MRPVTRKKLARYLDILVAGGTYVKDYRIIESRSVWPVIHIKIRLKWLAMFRPGTHTAMAGILYETLHEQMPIAITTTILPLKWGIMWDGVIHNYKNHEEQK